MDDENVSRAGDMFIKDCPTVFPTGMGIHVLDDQFYMIDFLDYTYSDGPHVVGTFVLPEKGLLGLKESIEHALDSVKDSKDEA